jgi:hypothetical protein
MNLFLTVDEGDTISDVLHYIANVANFDWSFVCHVRRQVIVAQFHVQVVVV